MIIFPAMDLKSGNCIRLQKGDFNKETIFDSNPLKVAKQFEKEGATWIHIIDLDGAYDGINKNINIVKDILENTNLQIQFGGGIRDIKKIEALLEIGVSRVILGTFAIKQFDKLKGLSKAYPNRLIVSVDSRNGYVTYNGWQEDSKIDTVNFCIQLEQTGIETIVYTDISKDGMMLGPNYEDYISIRNKTNLNVIASGGVRDCSDIQKLKKTNVIGAIVGKSIYIKQTTVKELIECSQEE